MAKLNEKLKSREDALRKAKEAEDGPGKLMDLSKGLTERLMMEEARMKERISANNHAKIAEDTIKTRKKKQKAKRKKKLEDGPGSDMDPEAKLAWLKALREEVELLNEETTGTKWVDDDAEYGEGGRPEGVRTNRFLTAMPQMFSSAAEMQDTVMSAEERLRDQEKRLKAETNRRALEELLRRASRWAISNQEDLGIADGYGGEEPGFAPPPRSPDRGHRMTSSLQREGLFSSTLYSSPSPMYSPSPPPGSPGSPSSPGGLRGRSPRASMHLMGETGNNLPHPLASTVPLLPNIRAGMTQPLLGARNIQTRGLGSPSPAHGGSLSPQRRGQNTGEAAVFVPGEGYVQPPVTLASYAHRAGEAPWLDGVNGEILGMPGSTHDSLLQRELGPYDHPFVDTNFGTDVQLENLMFPAIKKTPRSPNGPGGYSGLL